MRRARTADWLLLVTLLSAHAAVVSLGLRNYLPHAGWWFPYSVTGAQGENGLPFVDRVNTPDCPLRVGDRLLAANGAGLRGLSRAEVYRAQTPLLVGGRPYRVTAEREGEQLEVSVQPAAMPGWRGKFFGLMPVTLTAIFLLLRAPHWHLSRRFFAATIAVATFPPADVGQLPWVAVTAIPAGTALMLWCGLEGTEASRPLRRWQQLLPWALGSIYALCMAVYLLSTIPAGLWPYRGTWGGTAVMMIALLLRWSGPTSAPLRSSDGSYAGFFSGSSSPSCPMRCSASASRSACRSSTCSGSPLQARSSRRSRSGS